MSTNPPPAKRGRRYGKAGTSLHSENSGGKKYARTARTGAAGERRFSKFVQSHRELNQYWVYESLRIPAKRGQKRYSSDVDAAIVSGNRVVLIDVKAWKAGKFYWSAFGKIWSGMTPTDYKLSQNMQMAKARYQESLGEGVRIVPITVFVPTKNGTPSSVKFLRFPGGVKSYLMGDCARKIISVLKDPEDPTREIEALFGSMTRDR